MLSNCGLFWSFIYVKFTRCHALLLWHFFGLLSMPISQDAMFSYCGLSLVFYLCQVHKMQCFVIVNFLWSFIYVKFTNCHALLLWPFFGLLSMSNSQDAVLCYCGISLVFYLCQVHKMLCFLIVAFLWSFIYTKFTMPCFLIVAFLWSFIYAKFTRCRAFLLWLFFGHLSMPNSQDAVLSYCGFSLVFYLCQIHKMLCFLLWHFFGLLSIPSFSASCELDIDKRPKKDHNKKAWYLVNLA